MHGALSHREHARLAGALIAECGGLDEAARNCRVSKQTLSTYQNPHERATMPADVMDALQSYCGKSLYSDALTRAQQSPVLSGVENLKDTACQLSEETLSLQALVREALADGRLTPRELDAIGQAKRQAGEALNRLHAVLMAAEAGTRPRVIDGGRL